MSDAVNVHLAALGFDAVGKFVAVRLADGSSDGVLYDHKQAAVSHQAAEFHYEYTRITPRGMPVCVAEGALFVARKMYDAGWRLPDRDAAHGGLDLIPALTREDHARQLAALR